MVFSKMRQLFRTYPLVSNMVITTSIYGAGDVNQQTLMGAEKYNWPGTGRIMTIAFCGFGPFYYYWYKFLDGYFPGKAVRTVLPKLFVDQFGGSPPCLFMFFVGTSILEGKEDIFAELKEKGLKTFGTGCVFWPIAQLVNFFLIPPAFRAVYVSSAAFVWSSVVCYIKAQPSKSEKASSSQLETGEEMQSLKEE